MKRRSNVGLEFRCLPGLVPSKTAQGPVVELSSIEVSAGEYGFLEVRTNQYRILQMSMLHFGPLELSPGEVCTLLELSGGEDCIVELRRHANRAVHVGGLQVRSREPR